MIEPDAEPPSGADVRRHEIVTRLRGHQCLLGARRGMTPDRHASIAVMIVQEHHKQLVANAKRRRTPGDLLRCIRKGETDSTHSRQRRLRARGRETRLRLRLDRHLRGFTDRQLRGRPHTLIDQHEEASGPRHDFAFKWNAVDGATNAMAAAAPPQRTRRNAPARGWIEWDFERRALVALQERGCESRGARRHINSRMILSSASRGGRLLSSIEYSG